MGELSLNFPISWFHGSHGRFFSPNFGSSLVVKPQQPDLARNTAEFSWWIFTPRIKHGENGVGEGAIVPAPTWLLSQKNRDLNMMVSKATHGLTHGIHGINQMEWCPMCLRNGDYLLHLKWWLKSKKQYHSEHMRITHEILELRILRHSHFDVHSCRADKGETGEVVSEVSCHSSCFCLFHNVFHKTWKLRDSQIQSIYYVYKHENYSFINYRYPFHSLSIVHPIEPNWDIPMWQTRTPANDRGLLPADWVIALIQNPTKIGLSRLYLG